MSDPVADSRSDGVTACYVYGVVPAGTVLDPAVAAAGLGDGVELMETGDLAAVVEAVDPGRPFGTRSDLLAHSTVLDGLAVSTAVVPLRFGTVLVDADAVVDEVLAGQGELFGPLLGRLAGSVQYRIRGRYDLDAVLAEVVAADPEVAALRERTRDLPEEAGYYDRIRLGELVAAAVEERRERDTEEALAALGPLALGVERGEASGMGAAVDLALLVDDSVGADLEAAAESLAARAAGRISFSLLGPMAPYDFVPAG